MAEAEARRKRQEGPSLGVSGSLGCPVSSSRIMDSESEDETESQNPGVVVKFGSAQAAAEGAEMRRRGPKVRRNLWDSKNSEHGGVVWV